MGVSLYAEGQHAALHPEAISPLISAGLGQCSQSSQPGAAGLGAAAARGCGSNSPVPTEGHCCCRCQGVAIRSLAAEGCSAPRTPNGWTFQVEPPRAPQHLSLGWGHPIVVSPPHPRDPEWPGDPVPPQPQGHCWLRGALGASGVGPTIISGVYWKRKRIGNPSLSGLCRSRDTRRQRQAELSTAGQMVPGCCTDMRTLTRGHTDTHTHSLNATLAHSLAHRTRNRVGGGHCLASGT